ncbi:hypothetical protein RHMOL_Rhmol01G0174500 [Rhododendron molle]|uniref:Uncharacterized protein n=1 Tax=Rhododendron molle TaxID=49168 RepID=A0ACC0Q570_RHOML|nr:hypothetical protein RHMOL_Rhmol01G0174500 [Rhododendron molle]
MTNQLVEDPYFPHAFPYIYDFNQEHGAIPLPDHEEEGDANAIPILVQIEPFHDNEIEELEEDLEEEHPEEDPEKDPEEFNNPPQNEADWQHLMQMPNPNLPSDDEEDEGWQSDDEEILAEEPNWPELVMPDVIDIYPDSDDVPPPPIETDIGPYTAQFPNIFQTH